MKKREETVIVPSSHAFCVLSMFHNEYRTCRFIDDSLADATEQPLFHFSDPSTADNDEIGVFLVRVVGDRFSGVAVQLG